MIKYNQFNQAALVAIIVIHNATIYREIYAKQIMNFFYVLMISLFSIRRILHPIL